MSGSQLAILTGVPLFLCLCGPILLSVVCWPSLLELSHAVTISMCELKAGVRLLMHISVLGVAEIKAQG